jgi:hypothetical protein
MRSHSWSKAIAISWALAAAGILACAGALLDAFVPRGSFAGFFTWLAVMGFIVVGTVVGYAWVCDQYESGLDQRNGQSVKDDWPNLNDVAGSETATDPPPRETGDGRDGRAGTDLPTLASRGRCGPTLLVSARHTDTHAPGPRVRPGQ